MSKRRSKWAAAKGRDTSYSGQFAGRLCEMLELPAYRVLTLAAHRVLARLEVELMRHGGNDNGHLAVTYPQFIDYGVRKNSVAAAVRELKALGFIEITERGCAGNAGYGKPNQYRLIYRSAVGAPADGSHEWRRVKTVEDALTIQKEAHCPPSANVLKRGGNRVRKQKPSTHIAPNSPPTSHPDHPPHRGVNDPNSRPPHRGASSISRSTCSAAPPATDVGHGLRPERSGPPAAAALLPADAMPDADEPDEWAAAAQ